MRFKTIEIKNYRVFGDTSVVFKEGLNIIIGGNGTGKTTLYLMLQNSCFSANKDISLKDYRVVIGGKAEIKHMPYMFLDGDHLWYFNMGSVLLEMEKKNKAKQFARILSQEFKRIHPYPYAEYKRKGKPAMRLSSAGNYLLSFAAILAVRRIEKIDAPVVLDCCFARLQPKLRNQVISALGKLKCQVIVFETEWKKPDYVLNYDPRTERAKIVRPKTIGG